MWLPLLKDHCHTLANFEIRYFPKVPLMVFFHLSSLLPKGFVWKQNSSLNQIYPSAQLYRRCCTICCTGDVKIHHHKSRWWEERAGHSMTNWACTHKHSCNKSAMTRKVVRRMLQLLWLSEGLWTSSWGSPMSHQLFRKFWCHTTRTVPVQG